MTTERTNELEFVNQTIRELLETHNCSIKVGASSLKTVIICDNDKPNDEYVFASGLVKTIKNEI